MSVKAQKGDTVKVHYTGRLKEGEVFDSSEGREPLEFVLGAGHVIEGFDSAIIGMEESDKKTVDIPVEQAYGERNEDYVLRVGRDKLPPDLEPVNGMPLSMPMPDGTAVNVVISDFNENEIELDANPPLAGKDLIFDLELVGILRM